MRLKERHVSELNSVVDVLSRIHGVVGVFLFGSFARGDYDEYSDYDLLTLFEDKASMWQNWDKLFQSVTRLKMNLHVIPETLEELKAANPVFLDELHKHGRVLFAKFPLEVFSEPARLKTFSLIIYNMHGLSHSDKMKTIYFLYRKNGQGVVAQTGGKRLGESCFLIPSSVSNEIIDKLRALGVETKKLEIHVSEDQLET
jgi:predicted nucleotidyltransferase